MYEQLCTWRAFSNPWTVAKGRYDIWSKVSVTLEDDSKTIMGAEFTMSEKRSEEKSTEMEINVKLYYLIKHHYKVGTKPLGNYYLNNDWQVRQSLWLIDSTPVPGSLLWQVHASMTETQIPELRILPTITSQSCGNAIKYDDHLKALQEHLSSQFTCLLSWSPAHSSRTFCSLTKWSRFGSKSIHQGKAKLYQTLSHMIPTKHAAQHKCLKSCECKN